MIVATAVLLSSPAAFGQTPDPVRGKYLLAAAGCAACHTDKKNKGPALAVGLLKRCAAPAEIFAAAAPGRWSWRHRKRKTM